VCTHVRCLYYINKTVKNWHPASPLRCRMKGSPLKFGVKWCNMRPKGSGLCWWHICWLRTRREVFLFLRSVYKLTNLLTSLHESLLHLKFKVLPAAVANMKLEPSPLCLSESATVWPQDRIEIPQCFQSVSDASLSSSPCAPSSTVRRLVSWRLLYNCLVSMFCTLSNTSWYSTWSQPEEQM